MPEIRDHEQRLCVAASIMERKMHREFISHAGEVLLEKIHRRPGFGAKCNAREEFFGLRVVDLSGVRYIAAVFCQKSGNGCDDASSRLALDG